VRSLLNLLLNSVQLIEEKVISLRFAFNSILVSMLIPNFVIRGELSKSQNIGEQKVNRELFQFNFIQRMMNKKLR
jgi:hypothetical protein